MQTIEVRGETLHYERAGSGPPLLLVHSLGTGAWLWRDEIRRWSSLFDVIAVDARGHGRSTARGAPTVPEIAADLAAVIAALGLAPAHVVAISMGGPISAHLIAQAPGSVASLVIADSFANQGEAGAKRAETIAAVVRDVGMAEFGRRYAQDTLLPATPRPVFDELAASLGAMDAQTYIACATSVFTSDVRDLMAAIRVPVRIVVGERDNRTPPALSEAIAALIPGAGLHHIADAAHLANLDQPERFEAAVLSFLTAQAGL
ncbi:alpha/beta fold hydrolase [Labrys wisconsinensis]|uniref:3-oxoadipate enol-lactonase n=1 Tax=Labrys wisconsinensis TaxID=425677 RepID=A0ABU0J0J8_9HYPH|nr:alpha/beta fold hydrolase [Labrys wisconsinensis]MDQ0467781.1 3-oxoadipate enol-lactonase [Labrys wisconsinensis]